MRWPWKRRRQDQAALEDARRALAKVRAQWPVVHEQAAETRMHKRRNHLGENIRTIYRESRP
jgi:hypothetical protein